MIRTMSVVLAIAVAALPAEAQTLTGDREREGAPHRVQVEGTLAGRRVRSGGPVDPWGTPAGWRDWYAGGIAAYGRVLLAGERGPVDESDHRVRTFADLDLGVRSFIELFTAPDGSQAPFRVGNPYLGASAGIATAAWTVRGGGGLGLPVASAFDRNAAERTAIAESLHSLGAWDAWLVLSDVVPLVIRGDAAYDIGPFFAGVEVGASLMPFVAARVGEGPSYLAAQLGAWAGGRIEDLVALGLRGQVVGLVQYDGPTGFGGARYEEGFAALVPFVRLERPRWSVEARGTINLDDPIGVFGEGPRNWSIRLQFGYTL